MTKNVTVVAFLLGLLAAAVVGGAELLPTSVMADTAAQTCHQVDVALDEGYGVSRSESRLECSAD